MLLEEDDEQGLAKTSPNFETQQLADLLGEFPTVNKCERLPLPKIRWRSAEVTSIHWNHSGEAGRTLSRLAIMVALFSDGCGQSTDHGTGEATGGARAAEVDAASGGSSAVNRSDGGKGKSGMGGAMAVGGTGGANREGGTGGAMAVGDAGATGDAGGTGGAGGVSGAGGTGAMTGGAPPGPSCLDGITDYENVGPFKLEAKASGSVKVWIPIVPAGCKVPVIHLANGTGASCDSYVGILERLATHGFLAACYEDPNTSAGTQCITALETVFEMYPDLADNKIGSTAHGGEAAFTCVQLAEEKWGDSMIYTGLAMEPESGSGSTPDWMATYGKITSPMFMFSALVTDGLVSQAWVQQSYDALSSKVEAYFWTANGAKHIPVPVGEATEISIPWFRWKLLGDQKACAFFKAMPTTNTKWAEAASKNAKPCM